MNIGQEPTLIDTNSLVSSSTQSFRLGTRGVDKSGRVYRYCLAGAVDLVAGNCVQSPAIVTNYLAMTPSVVAAAATAIPVTPGATAAAANLFAEGYLGVDTTPGNGYAYSIASHPAFAGSDLQTVVTTTDDAVVVALTASSTVGMLKHPYKGVIQVPVTTATGIVVGIAVYIIKAGQYGWIGTWGVFPVLIAGTPALGAMVLSPSSAAGAAIIMTTTNLIVAQVVGNMCQIGVDGKNNFVFVRLGA